jgi:predicted ribosome quality control (RQC) complex YloA/Tae2 family protein
MKSETFLYDGILYSIFIGGNKYENTELINTSNTSDVWFHVSDASSCHVFLKNEGKLNAIPKQVIKRCAYLCKINTNSAKSMPKCDIVYTVIANVQTTDIPGAVLTLGCKKICV